jgi:uncharacterized protein DUF5946
MTFGRVQADEMQRFGYPAVHRVVVDTYMAQHPADGSDRRDRQSVFVHLIGLCAVLEVGLPAQRATEAFRTILREHSDFPILRRAAGPGDLTVLHLVETDDLAHYEERALEWAREVWQSWAEQHHVIRAALAAAIK